MLGNNIYIGKGNKVTFGGGCRINENVYVEAAAIGNDVLIAPNVSIISRTHEFSRIDILIALQGYSEEKPVTIASNVWLGRNVVVLPGVTIGEGAIIGAGPVVTKDIEKYEIVAGVPARKIKIRRYEL
jgi:acetyltransferase-like isoleucine patch superfamily enzyme